MRHYVRVRGYYVPLEEPPSGPEYDRWHVMAAAVVGWFLGVGILAAMVLVR
jgi:hypothetical protein